MPPVADGTDGIDQGLQPDSRQPHRVRPPRPSDRPPLPRGEGGGFDRPRPAYDRPRPGLDRPRPGYDRPRPDYDRPRPDAWSRRPATAAGEVLELAEGEELVAGRRPVEEAFVARREARRLLVVPQRRLALEKLVLHATSLRIPVVEVEGGSLTAIAGFDGHQGVALVVAPRQWAGLDDILALAAQRDQPPLVLVLDSLEDPQNVGTLLRSAEASGVHGAIFPTHRQAPMTPAAVKASAGATEHLRLAPVDDLPGALADLHVRGLRIVGADGDALLSAREADLRGPIAIVVGSEGRGLGPAVRRRCDLLVRIPMHGRIGSLNAAVAGSILLYEAAAQRGLPDNAPTTGNAQGPDDAPPPDVAPTADVAADAPSAESGPETELPAEDADHGVVAVIPSGDDAAPAATTSARGARKTGQPRSTRARASTAPTTPTTAAGDDLLPGGPPDEALESSPEPPAENPAEPFPETSVDRPEV